MDLSLIESAQIALEAEDIPTVLSADNATGLPSSPSTLAVVDDNDYNRARVVLAGLQQSTFKPWWEAPWAPRIILFLILMLVVAVCGILIF